MRVANVVAVSSLVASALVACSPAPTLDGRGSTDTAPDGGIDAAPTKACPRPLDRARAPRCASWTFGAPATGPLNVTGTLVVGDVNQDGLDDLAWSHAVEPPAVAFAKSEGGFEEPHALATGPRSSYVALANVHEGCAPELAVAGKVDGAPSIAEISFRSADPILPSGDRRAALPGFPGALAAGDFSGSGYAEALVAIDGPESSLVRVRSDVDGVTVGPPFRITERFPWLLTGDLDEDGREDIVLAPRGTYEKRILALRAGPDLSLATMSASALPERLVALSLAEVTGDVHLDLVIATEKMPAGATGVTRRIEIRPGMGDGAFGLGTVADPSVSGPMVVEDFDGDGVPEIAVRAQGKNEIVLLEPRGGALFGPGARFPIATAGEPTAVGDFDGDGRPDLVLVDASGAVTVLHGRCP